ncbi:MAG: hypothetical protein L6Q46_13265 [Flavobacterium sp.]|jgi:hypothetical protein|uniref:hypothetical protein n=1 Tax=Flavobacterium sp. TaxID=239 RepID=UPI0025BCD4CD|nr:hypothetical protein [Flavobacterium sp.]MCK6609249.1 hypothetical protein [Flavobacterium sp.]
MNLKEQLESIKDNVKNGGDYGVEMKRLKQAINSTQKDAELKVHLCNIVDAGTKETFDEDFSLVVFSLGSMPDKD